MEIKDDSLIFQNFVRTIPYMKPRMGRPPKSGDGAMTDRLEIRVSSDEKRSYEEAAQAAEMDRSDWIRSALNEAAKRVLRSNRRD